MCHVVKCDDMTFYWKKGILPYNFEIKRDNMTKN